MSVKKNKIILNKIPLDIDNEELQLAFESTAFGYQTVLGLTELRTYQDLNQKDVVIEFDTPEAAKEVIKKRDVVFDFDNRSIHIRPFLYLENFDQSTQPESFKNDLESLYTCWIGNIPNKYTEDKLKDFFSQQLDNLSIKVHSIKPLLNPKRNKYQCFINFYTLTDAKKVIEYFDGSKMDSSVLEARFRTKETSISESLSDSDSDCSEVSQPEPVSKQHEKIFRVRGKNFKDLIIKQVEVIRIKYAQNVSVIETRKSRRNSEYTFIVRSDDELKMKECFNELSSKVKVLFKTIKFSKIEFEQVSKLKEELIKCKPNKDFYYLFLDDKKSSVVVEFFDSGVKESNREYHRFLNRIQKMCDLNTNVDREYTISDLDKFDYLKMWSNKQTNVKFTFTDKHKVVVSGKKLDVDKLNLNDFVKQIKSFKVESKIKNKSIISYMNFKMGKIRNEFESSGYLLKYGKIEKNSETFSFRIVGVDFNKLKQKSEEIQAYFDKVRLVTVKHENTQTGKSIEKAILDLKLDGCDIKYRDDLKIFFLNGVDANVLNMIKQKIESFK